MNFFIVISVLLFSVCQSKFFIIKTKEENAERPQQFGKDYMSEDCERGQIFSPKDGKCHDVITKYVRASFGGTKIDTR